VPAIPVVVEIVRVVASLIGKQNAMIRMQKTKSNRVLEVLEELEI
jgi:hypothetical protein